MRDRRQRDRFSVSSSLLHAASTHSFPDIAERLHSETHTFPSTNLYRIPNGNLDHRSGLVFIDGEVVAQSGFGYRSAQDSAFVTAAGIRAQDPNLQQARPEGASLAFLGRVDNWYHFLIEALPRILAIKEADPSTTFAATTSIPTYIQDVLDSLNITVLPWVGRDAVYRSSVVWVVTPPELWWPDPFSITALRNRFLDLSTHGEFGQRLYISRSLSNRSLPDETNLENELQALGFSVVHLEKLPLRSQVDLLSNVDMIVAPHGAGLANLLFAKSGACVVEIANPNHWFPCYARIAELLSLTFHTISMDPSNENDLHSRVSKLTGN